jgi:uncharacterized protein with FMN-binding domain
VAAQLLLAQSLSHQQAEKLTREIWRVADARRAQGKYEDASKLYERAVKVLANCDIHGTTADKTTWGTACRQMIELCKAMPIDISKLKEGDYEGSAWGYQGNMTVGVTIRGGRIKQFTVKSQAESSPRKALEVVPAFIVRKQSPSVDASTGATMTSYGLMAATQRALDKAKPAEK